MSAFSKQGDSFTFLELLVSIGILAIFFSIVLIAVNPREQIDHANDIASKALVSDFAAATLEYYSQYKILPWQKSTECQREFITGNSLAQAPSCLFLLSKGGNLGVNYQKSPQFNDIYIARCNESSVLCYSPRSKTELKDAEAHYNKFGVNQPGCPGLSEEIHLCYWCRPLNNGKGCGQPSPTQIPSIAPTHPTASPTPLYADLVPGYKIDETKFLQTYAVYFFDYPGFSGGWNMQLSLRPDFGGDYTQTIYSFGIPDSYCQDAPINTSYTALRKITSKYVGLASVTSGYYMYNNNCGKTVYWRITNYYSPSATNKKEGPTYTGIIDCSTKVGVVDPPLSWYTVFDQGGTNKQKQYIAAWDFDRSGEIDWTDYWLGTFSTKFRAGGWTPPE